MLIALIDREINDVGKKMTCLTSMDRQSKRINHLIEFASRNEDTTITIRTSKDLKRYCDNKKKEIMKRNKIYSKKSAFGSFVSRLCCASKRCDNTAKSLIM